MKCLCSKSKSRSKPNPNAKSSPITDHANMDEGCIRFKCQCSTCKKARKATGCHSTCCKLAGVGIIVAGTAGLLSLLWLSSKNNKVL